jgi:tRNA dimethylallyltransferase
MLKKLDPTRAANIDPQNPRRLIRAIEILKDTGHPIPIPLHTPVCKDVLQLGIRRSSNDLKKLIHERLQKRLHSIIVEVKRLHKNGLSFKRLEELGLEYRFTAQYLQKKITKQEMIDKIQLKSEHFAKRQMTWFKRDTRIQWVNTSTSLNAIQHEAKKLVENFLK